MSEKRVILCRYKHISNNSEDGYKICIYCGELANTKEHLTPVSLIDIKHEHHFNDNEKPKYNLTTDACLECNSILSNFRQIDPLVRLSKVKQRLRKRYKNILIDNANWSQEELNELSYTLRSSININLSLRRRLDKRLDYYPPIALINRIQNLQSLTSEWDKDLNDYFEQIKCTNELDFTETKENQDTIMIWGKIVPMLKDEPETKIKIDRPNAPIEEMYRCNKKAPKKT